MSDGEPKLTWRNHLQWWLYTKCFAFCVRCVHPDANPSEFSILDDANFIAISRDEVQELIQEAPGIAWHFGVEVAS